MEANFLHCRYKSKEDCDAALAALDDLAGEIQALPGLQAFHLVRLKDDEHVHMGVFDTPEHAQNARESIGRRVFEILEPRARDRLDLGFGPVLVHLPE